MIRTPLILVASFGLLAGCATSSANSTPSNNPDAGKVDYDVGKSGGSGDAGAGSGSNDGGGSNPTTAPKGRDQTATKAVGVSPKAVKKIAAAKPPKPEPTEPADPAKPVPPRKGRVDPNGLLAEAFTIDASTTKLPDFAGLTSPSALFIAPTIDGTSATPLAGLPSSAKAPLALRFTGSLNVTKAAEYRLCTKSSDGSQLYIESTLVVDNDGVKATPAEACEVVNLEPGEYALEVRSFHVSGGVQVQLSWAEGKDGTPAAVAKSSLFKPEGADDRVKAAKKR